MPKERFVTRVTTTCPRIERLPAVAVGPDAESALSGRCGVLVGARRAEWIDVVRVEPEANGLETLVGRRFEDYHPWEAVGISLRYSDWSTYREWLLEALVPGDVVTTEKGVSVHAGDRWDRAQRSPR